MPKAYLKMVPTTCRRAKARGKTEKSYQSVKADGCDFFVFFENEKTHKDNRKLTDIYSFGVLEIIICKYQDCMPKM